MSRIPALLFRRERNGLICLRALIRLVSIRRTKQYDLQTGRSIPPAIGRKLLPYLFAFLALPFAQAAQPLTVQLNWKHQFEFAAFYAALEKGYYRDAGLDVTIKEGGPGVDVVTEVVSGNADFGVGTSSLVIDRYEGKNVVAVATLMQHSPIALMARKTPSLRSVHDLAGMPIAVDPHSRDEIEAYLRAAGLPPAQIKFVDQTDWRLESLDSGKEAAKVVYVSNEPFWIQGKEHDYLTFTPRSAGIDLFGNMLFASENTVRRHVEEVRLFREATTAGLAYALKNPGEMVELILAKYNSQQKSREHLLFEAAQITELTRPDIVEPGHMSPGRWRHVVDVYARQNKIPENFPLDGFLYDDHKPTVPQWVWWVGLVILAALSMTSYLVARFRALNFELHSEVAERLRAESELRAREAQLRANFENTPNVSLQWYDEQGRVTYWNPASERLFGWSQEEAMGKTLDQLIYRPEDASTFLGFLSDIARTGESHGPYESRVRNKAGEELWILSTTFGFPLGDGRLGFACMDVDITTQKQAQAELNHYNESLKQQVDLRTSELLLAKNQAEAASQAKSTFLANMSHELRTPFHGILGTIALARNRMQDPKGLDCLDRAKAATKHLLAVVNDILDISKIEAGRMTIEPHDFQLETIFGDLAHVVEHQLDQKQVALHFDLPRDISGLWLSGDAVRIAQVLINLVGNAVKFTDHGNVTISVRESGQVPSGMDTRLRFEIADTGIGIPPERQNAIFDSFEQADNSLTRRYGGTGLGLAISKRLVEMMGGEIGLHSTAGVGSTFWFTLPLAKSTRGDNKPSALISERAEEKIKLKFAGRRVLVVDDEPINLEIAKTCLEDAGLAVDTAGDGAEARDLAACTCYALIVMDLQMPVLNGLKATEEIRAGNVNTDTPIIALTANAYAEDKTASLQAGMDDFMSKPVDPAQLYEKTLFWLENADRDGPAKRARLADA